jgi:hypothetical protein
MRKNLPRISARAYAYRPDLTPHDAIAYVKSEFGRHHRIFVAEYDFSKFFDTVNHEFVQESLDRLGVIRTPLEEFLIQQFLKSPEPYFSESENVAAPEARRTGVPQGTSVSLFLANIAASEIDRNLERLGVGFARYADDTLIWSDDYGRICQAAEVLHEESERIGSPINAEKSPGIRLLVGENSPTVEMASTRSVDYLGHTISLRSAKMKEATKTKIKKRLQHLIYTNLLLEPLRNAQEPAQLTDVDRDYVTAIWQIRRYLYGPLSEADIRRFHSGRVPPMSFEGVMSFFPLIDDDVSLRELDAWLASELWLAMRKREKLLAREGLRRPRPLGLGKDALIDYQTTSRRNHQKVDLRIPSFTRMARVIRAAVNTHGLGVVAGDAPLYLYGSES